MFAVDGTDSSNQVNEIRSGLVKKYIKDRANAPVNVTKSELEQHSEEPQFPFEAKDGLSLDILHCGNTVGQRF